MRLPPTPSRVARSAVGALCALVVAAGAVSCDRSSDGSEGTYSGVSVRQRSPDAISDTSEAFEAHPELALVSAMVPWNLLEPEDQTFVWDQLDANIEDAREHGYRIILRIMAGRLAPAWLPSQGMATVEILGTDPNAFDYCQRVLVPVPWDPVLEAQYRELMEAVSQWTEGSDGGEGTKGDHVLVVPISMPSVLGSEMQIGFGPDELCPQDTDGAGTNLADTNRARWTALAPVAELRALTEEAWQRAIDLHVGTLTDVPSAVAYGGIFGDDLDAARRLADTNVPEHADLLWSMFTNLQPDLGPDGAIVGPWSSWCSACDAILVGAMEAGGSVALQLAATEGVDQFDELEYAIDEAVDTYELRFLEVNPEIVDAFPGYLLTDPGSVQDRIREKIESSD